MCREDYPKWIQDAAMPCRILGETKQRRQPVFSPDACLPDKVGALIHMEQGI